MLYYNFHFLINFNPILVLFKQGLYEPLRRLIQVFQSYISLIQAPGYTVYRSVNAFQSYISLIQAR